MLIDKNKSISLIWELNSIFMYISFVLNPNMSECYRGPKEKQNKTKNTIILNIGGEGFTYSLLVSVLGTTINQSWFVITRLMNFGGKDSGTHFVRHSSRSHNALPLLAP